MIGCVTLLLGITMNTIITIPVGDIRIEIPNPTEPPAPSEQPKITSPIGDWGIGSVELDVGLMGRATTLLEDGTILLCGGSTYGSPNTYSNRCDVFDPVAMAFSQVSDLPFGGYNFQAQPLPNGEVLVFGGYSGSAYFDNSFIYAPATGLVRNTGDMPFATQSHASVLADDGKVFSFGGSSTGGIHGRVAVFDLVTETWQEIATMPHAAHYPSATKLGNGKVLIVGGRGAAYLETALLFDTDTLQFTAVQDAPVAMRGGFLSEVSDGLVLYSGGEVSGGSFPTNVYYYYVEQDQWITAEEPPERRGFTDAVQVDGRTFIFNGNDPSGSVQNKDFMTRDNQTTANFDDGAD